MRAAIKSLIICSALSLTIAVNAQTLNCNPDTNGEGGSILEQELHQGLTNRDLPEQYWVDIVTEQPEGYVVDENGDVHIYSAEALAWLSSVSNGLNGQQADDFEGKMVTLEANVDMSAAIWTSIAQGELGDTTPDRLRFSGTLDGNGFVISGITLYKKDQKSNSFLGTLEGARIEDVVLRHAYAEESNANDGKLFISADFVEGPRTTVIDRCFVEFDEIVKDAIFRDNTALFGYYNNGIIRNCMAVLHKADIYSDKGFLNDNLSLFVWDNKGTIENCASIADSVHWGYHYFLTGIAENNYASGTIENCYSFIDDLFYYEEMPFEQVPRAGICWENYGQVKNCYYNMWPGSDEHLDECHSFYDSPVNTSYGGEITETASFMPTPYFQYPYWVLNDSVNIPSPSGFIYSTDELQQALFYWVLGRQETGQYLWWCADESFFPNNLPSLCEIDINSIQEESTLKSCPVYPNPADDVFRIDGIVPDETLIYNALGQLVKSVNATNEVSVSDLPAGVYLLRITDNDGTTFTSRLSISR